ncbi:AraC-like DNA-binding protein [Inhella inkyongensis]|uniref:AraC-like DNA-binding protein n=1 Tax=Inhella inkyongensis TaxID=392593 RepID=A0A840S5H0_9BURK|nr:AraC family transcriptional regulator [Inhella inkyongensis]MBB5204728.1 AraC-like DNA-binding protein [Inhella inkyongensis]
MPAQSAATALPQVSEWHCSGRRSGWLDEESPQAFIELPTRGMDLRRLSGRQVVASPGRALLHAAHEGYALASPTDRPRRATCLSLPPELLDELAFDFQSMAVHSSTRSALLHWQLRQAEAASLDRDELMLMLVESVLADAREQAGEPAHQHGQGRISPAWERLAVALDERLAEGFTQALSLEQLARDCGASPFHACRVYRSVTGHSLHRQLNRLRLREALFRLPEMRGQLTALALELGFSSHSHFGSAFKAEFGRSPSALHSPDPGLPVAARPGP